jgi:hypothetical protein
MRPFNQTSPRFLDNYSALQSQGLTFQDLSYLDKMIGAARKAEAEGNSGSILIQKSIDKPNNGLKGVQLQGAQIKIKKTIARAI